MVAGQLVRDYCEDRFERWTKMRYGMFPAELDNTYAEIEKYYLCTRECPCVAVNGLTWTEGGDVDKLDYLTKYFNGTHLNSCWQPSTGTYQSPIVDYLRSTEKTHGCSGLCTPLPFFTFSNVGKGLPQEACSQHIIHDFEHGVFRKYSIVFYAAGALCFPSWFLMCGLCFRRMLQEKRKETVT